MRGCERKIIMLKGTDSEIFDEAYFLIRRDFKKESGGEIVREAERLVNVNTTRAMAKGKSKRDAVAFAMGALCGFAAGLVWLLL